MRARPQMTAYLRLRSPSIEELPRSSKLAEERIVVMALDLNGSSGCRYSNAAEQTHSWARMARLPMALWISLVSAIGSTRLTAKIFKQSTAAVLLTLFICGCVPTTTDTVTLSQAALAPPQSGRISSDGYRLEAVPQTSTSDQEFHALCRPPVKNGQNALLPLRDQVDARQRLPSCWT